MSEVDAAIAATRALIAKDQRIAELEAELAACEQVREAIAAESRDRYAELAEMRQEHERMVDQLHETLGLYADTRDELADLRASSVVYKVRCEGARHDGCGYYAACINGVLVCNKCGFGGRHHVCDNGWRLAEGVVRNEYRDGFGEPWYEIPARLIEGSSSDDA